jgi:hypothetical protein
MDSDINIARKTVYQNEFIDWLESHGSNIRQKVANEKTNKLQYQSLQKTLKHESNPDAVISYLLDIPTESTQQVTPRQIGRKARILVRRARPANEATLLSPAYILTERKRKDIISRLEKGENLVEGDNSVFESIRSYSSSAAYKSPPDNHHNHAQRSSNSYNQARQHDSSSKAHAFQPKWENYNTMRTRWRYIQPQVKALVGENRMLAPSTSTSYLQVNHTQLAGKYEDLRQFESSILSQQSRALNLEVKSPRRKKH